MKLFKRLDSPEAPWYCHFQVRGRRYLWSTKTADAFLARKRARNYREAAIAENFGLVDGMKARGGAITFQKLIDAYLELPAPEAKTKAVNVSGLKRLLKANGMSVATTIDRLGVEMALKWQQVAKAEQVPVATVNGILRRARSLFSRNCMLLYREKPAEEAVKNFFSVPYLKEPEGRPIVPTAAADAAAQTALPLEPDLWRAYILSRFCGLRAGEIRAAKKDWIDGNILCIGGKPSEYTPKGRRWRSVAIPDPLVPVLLASPSDYLVGETPHKTVERDMPRRLHQLGFPERHPQHALRRLFGQIVYNTQSPRLARDAMGHRDLSTTENHYARSVDIAAPVPYTPPAT